MAAYGALVGETIDGIISVGRDSEEGISTLVEEASGDGITTLVGDTTDGTTIVRDTTGGSAIVGDTTNGIVIAEQNGTAIGLRKAGGGGEIDVGKTQTT